MKKRTILLFSIVWTLCMYTQNHKDLLFLKESLLKRDYLFHTLNKKAFKKIIAKEFISDSLLDKWKIQSILSQFKELNLKVINDELKTSVSLKSVYHKLYITSISKNNDFLLESEVVAINNIPIAKIKADLREKFYFPHKNTVDIFLKENLFKLSFLQFLQLTDSDSVLIKTSNFKGFIHLENENMATIKIEKPMFKDLKPNKWFWSYGINFGQQVYLNFNRLLSNEHFNKLKDSLKWSNYKYAKTFQVPIQDTYKPLKYIDLFNKLHIKFSNNRYKKLILDLRNCNIGTSYYFNTFIYHLKKIKKLRSKNKIYILVNKHTNFASIKLILQFKKYFKPIIVGETIYGIKQDSNNFTIIELPNSKVQIKIPLQHQKEIEINADLVVNPSLLQLKKGIDATLNKCLE